MASDPRFPGQQYAGQPWQPSSAAPVRARDNTLRIVLIVVGVILGLGMLSCGGAMFFLARSINRIANGGGSPFAEFLDGQENEILADRLKDVDLVRQTVGDVQSVTYDHTRTRAAESDGGDAGQEWYRVVGTISPPSGGDIYVIATIASMDVPEQHTSDAILVTADGVQRPIRLSSVPYDSADSRTVLRQIADDQRLKNAVGEINHISVDERSYSAEAGISEYWYRVEGESGTALVQTDESNGIVVTRIELPDGSSYNP